MLAGIGSFAFGWAIPHASPAFDEHALLRFAAQHGAAVVQLADNLPVHTFDEARLASLAEGATGAGIRIELGARGLTESHLETYLALCVRCRSEMLRFVADGEGYEPDADDLAALLRNAVPALDRAGVTLALENHDRFGAATLRGIVESAGSPRVGVCLDTANSFGAGEGLDAVTATLAPVTVNLHVKDVSIRRLPYLMGFTIEGRPLGQGQLPIAAAIRAVHERGRCGSAILEAWTPPSARIEETISRELSGAESGIEVLKALVRGLQPDSR